MKIVPTIEGIIIILFSVVIFFGGAFTYQYFAIAQYEFEFKYPEDFLSSSQHPKLLVGDCNYNVFPNECPNINDIVIKELVEDGGDIKAVKNNLSEPNYWEDPKGEKQIIDNLPYCLYKNSDAGAGHIFNNYYYVTIKNNKCLVINFSINTINCNIEPVENYASCLENNKEQEAVLNQVLSTFKFTPVK